MHVIQNKGPECCHGYCQPLKKKTVVHLKLYEWQLVNVPIVEPAVGRPNSSTLNVSPQVDHFEEYIILKDFSLTLNVVLDQCWDRSKV